VSEIDGKRGIDAKEELRGSLPRGIILGSYELKSILGRGAFGITYRARDTTLHRDVAIKEYLPTALALRADGIPFFFAGIWREWQSDVGTIKQPNVGLHRDAPTGFLAPRAGPCRVAF
jgi:hypothetical protein